MVVRREGGEQQHARRRPKKKKDGHKHARAATHPDVTDTEYKTREVMDRKKKREEEDAEAETSPSARIYRHGTLDDTPHDMIGAPPHTRTHDRKKQELSIEEKRCPKTAVAPHRPRRRRSCDRFGSR